MDELSLNPQTQRDLSRRGFIKHFVVGTAFSTLLGRKWFDTVLAECTAVTAGAGILRVKISDFSALQKEEGSVRLALNPFNDNGPSGTFYPVLVNRGTGTQFFALSTRCTHMNCVVAPFDAGAGSCTCPCHGSQFRIDGTVIPGSDAKISLQQFTVNFDGVDLLCIELPSFRYVLTGTRVETGVGPRFRLQFPARARASYEILLRQSLADLGIVVPFSSTESGAATSTVFSSVTTTTATVYVDRTNQAGFYSVAIQIAEG